jgi:hypothetical protein
LDVASPGQSAVAISAQGFWPKLVVVVIVVIVVVCVVVTMSGWGRSTANWQAGNEGGGGGGGEGSGGGGAGNGKGKGGWRSGGGGGGGGGGSDVGAERNRSRIDELELLVRDLRKDVTYAEARITQLQHAVSQAHVTAHFALRKAHELGEARASAASARHIRWLSGEGEREHAGEWHGEGEQAGDDGIGEHEHAG